MPISRTYATGRSVEVDAVLLAGSPSEASARTLVDETFRHLKPIGVLPQGNRILEAAGASPNREGIFAAADASGLVDSLVSALGEHRVWNRVVPS